MKFVSNAGTNRVVDLIRPWLKPNHQLDVVSPSFSLFAFAEILADVPRLANARLVVPAHRSKDRGYPGRQSRPNAGRQRRRALHLVGIN